jgi:hypothetical protein
MKDKLHNLYDKFTNTLNYVYTQFIQVIYAFSNYGILLWRSFLLDIIISGITLKFYWRKFVSILYKVSLFLKHIFIGHSYCWLLITVITCIMISIFLTSWQYADYCWISVQVVLALTILTNLNETN